MAKWTASQAASLRVIHFTSGRRKMVRGRLIKPEDDISMPIFHPR